MSNVVQGDRLFCIQLLLLIYEYVLIPWLFGRNVETLKLFLNGLGTRLI